MKCEQVGCSRPIQIASRRLCRRHYHQSWRKGELRDVGKQGRGPRPTRASLPEHSNQAELARELGVSRQRVNQILNREKHVARMTVGKAVKLGRLKKPDRCECCNRKHAKLHAHHHDYNKPLDVHWLCPKCHAGYHYPITETRASDQANLKCKVCGYGWTPRKAKGGMPLRCPNPFCQSIFWNGEPVKKGYPRRGQSKSK